jgi:hypothetical protein
MQLCSAFGIAQTTNFHKNASVLPLKNMMGDFCGKTIEKTVQNLSAVDRFNDKKRI